MKSKEYISQIQAIFKKTGWTQARLAQELGVTFATVNRWLNAHSAPHPSQAKQIGLLHKKLIGILPVPREDLEKLFSQLKAKRNKFKNIYKILSSPALVDDFILELTYHSDSIEGSTLSKKETQAVIFDKATIKDKGLVEHLQAANHAAILKSILDGRMQCPITENLIKELHRRLMQGIRDDAGEYAKHKRAITGVDLILPHPDDILEEMESFSTRINRAHAEPISHIAKMHADFEAIHPFGDGNGRVGRLLMIMGLLEEGFAPCVINVGRKSEYYECLEYAQKKSSTHLVKLLAEAVLAGYTIVEKYI